MAQVQIVGDDLLIDGVAVMTFKPEAGVYERGQLKDWLEQVEQNQKNLEVYHEAGIIY
jgi:hypothetical protein